MKRLAEEPVVAEYGQREMEIFWFSLWCPYPMKITSTCHQTVASLSHPGLGSFTLVLSGSRSFLFFFKPLGVLIYSLGTHSFLHLLPTVYSAWSYRLDMVRRPPGDPTYNKIDLVPALLGFPVHQFSFLMWLDLCHSNSILFFFLHVPQCSALQHLQKKMVNTFPII